MTRVKLYQTRVCGVCGKHKPANSFANTDRCKACRARQRFEHQQNLLSQSIFTQEQEENIDIALNMIRSEYEK
jgi:uncharacterized CHY-type Zn-finger protein